MTAMQSISSADAEAFTPFSIPESNEALGEVLTCLAGHINAAHYRFLKLLAALIEREAWSCGSGIKSPAHWLNYYCGIDLGGEFDPQQDVSAETFSAPDECSFAQKRADALVEMADLAMSSVSSGGRPACCADRYQVVVHIAAAPYKMDYGIAVEGMMRMAGTLQAARPFQSETWVDAIPAGCC